MPKIGLDKLYYATITDGETGETYGTPTKLAGAIKVDMSAEITEGTLYSDDGPSVVVKEFKQGKLSLNVDDIGSAVAAALTGSTVDSKGVLVDTGEDSPKPVAIGFRARKSDGNYVYYWLYRVTFAVPSDNLQTKGESINFATPTIEGTVVRRKKADTKDHHPWRTTIDQSEAGADTATVTGWFSAVYEPTYNA